MYNLIRLLGGGARDDAGKNTMSDVMRGIVCHAMENAMCEENKWQRRCCVAGFSITPHWGITLQETVSGKLVWWSSEGYVPRE